MLFNYFCLFYKFAFLYYSIFFFFFFFVRKVTLYLSNTHIHLSYLIIMQEIFADILINVILHFFIPNFYHQLSRLPSSYFFLIDAFKSVNHYLICSINGLKWIWIHSTVFVSFHKLFEVNIRWMIKAICRSSSLF